MSDQEHEKADCPACNGSGIKWATWKRSKHRLCSFCNGAGQLTPDETVSRVKELADDVGQPAGF